MEQLQEALLQQFDENKTMLLGKNYNRLMISFNLPIEGKETFKFIEDIKKNISDIFEEKCYLIGDAGMGSEMNNGFSDELDFVTMLTVIAILIVVIFTFKSVLNSAVLVAVIQGAVYITTAICVLMGNDVNSIALILVQCILMGATIDYGILYSSNYIEERKSKDKIQSICISMRNSIKTILTSSLILVSTCLTVGLIMTQKIISQTCMIIAYGTICAVVMVVFVLPSVIAILDRFIVKKK